MNSSPNRLLAQWGRRYGHDPMLIQAGGGNMSVKTSARRMIIKASGVRLREMTSAFGCAAADPSLIHAKMGGIARLSSYRAQELSYAELLQKACQTPGLRVSMETGFHAIFSDRYVLHLHSVVGILLGMMPEKKARLLFDRLFLGRAQIHFAPPTLPGFELTHHMMDLMDKKGTGRVQLWILRNHGVVWTGDDKDVVLKNIDRFERALRSFFQLKRYSIPHTLGSARCRLKSPKLRVPRTWRHDMTRAVCFCHWPKCQFALEPLFPDFVIYFNLWGGTDKDLIKMGSRQALIGARTWPQWQDKKEVLYAHVLVSTIAEARGDFQRMPKPMIHKLVTMETERLRKKEILKK